MTDSSLMNTTKVEGLSSSELHESYKLLKKQYESLSSNYEAMKQELYETKRKYETSLEIQSQFRSDLESCKVDEQKQRNEFLSQIAKLQEEISALRDKRSSLIEQGSTEINRLKEENIRLKEKRTVVSRKSPERDTKEVDEINSKLLLAAEESAVTKAALEEAKREIVSWQMKFEELVTEVGELRVAADIRKEEIKTVLENEAVALAELAETKAMLNQVDSGEATKGNSIFAEVEDKRQEIAKNLLQMKQSNAKLRQELSSKQMELEALIHEKQTVWEEQAGAIAHYDRELIDSYEDRITQLEALCERHRREICRWFAKTGDPAAPGWLPEFIDHWKLECELLRGELLSQAPNRISSTALIRDLRRKIALLSDNRKQSPGNDLANRSEISVYKIPNKVEVKKDVKKKVVSFN